MIGVIRHSGLLQRGLAFMAAAAMWLALGGMVLPPPVDAEMVERALAGAEWLAERAKENPERAEAAKGAEGLVDWLLTAGGATGPEYDAFGAYLAVTGYENPLFAVQAWSSEIAMVTAAAEAHDRSASLRPIAEIEAELKTLPTVPLDDEGREERRRLLEELELAAIPQQERDTAGAASARLAKLRAEAGLEGLQ